MIISTVPKNPNIYICEICNYKTGNKKDYNKHLATGKHKKVTNDNDMITQIPTMVTCLCGNSYKHRSGLSRHKKKCTYEEHNDATEDIPLEEPINDTNSDTDVKVLSNTIFELVKQNNEFKQLLIEQNKKMMELAGNMGNNNNNVNSHNKFNLNVFLNEKCKNAMTLKDFVKSINISVQDFIETGERGFIDGISNIIVERINEMELHDRPLHCTDLKRETVYIKDENKWEKDEDNVKLRKAVKGVAYKNERMRPVWYDSTPDVGIMGTDNYEKFFKYSESALGGCGREETKTFEDKVMRNVLKEVTIDKENV
tara:strand:+ start:455 stop:1390 length:936 start_codon:yes stop_codon:yes gene_type:complete